MFVVYSMGRASSGDPLSRCAASSGMQSGGEIDKGCSVAVPLVHL